MQEQQPSLFGEIENKVGWTGMALSVSSDQREIMRWIMRLYNDGDPPDVDATYSIGVFYQDLPKPQHKFDINPQIPGVQKADSRSLPLEDQSVKCLVFDPPFKMSISHEEGIIQSRFSSFSSPFALWDYYRDSLVEFNRVLKPKGIVIFKCQDQISSGKQWWTQHQVHLMAAETGFDVKDQFILVATSVIWSPNMRNQKHARKAHSYFIVLEKKKGARHE